MKQSLQLNKFFILCIASAILVSCGGGASNSQNAAAQSTLSAATTSSSQTYTINAIAGMETDLMKLAQIDGRLNKNLRGDVWIDYSGPVVGDSHRRGLVALCDGIEGIKDCRIYSNMIFTKPGKYSYTVSYLPYLSLFRKELKGTIIVKPASDFIVVSIGDSVASGEGDPQILLSTYWPAYWNDMSSDYQIEGIDGCRRSAHAGPALAVRDLQADNAANNSGQYITFVHIACSGASLYNTPKKKQEGNDWVYGKINSINRQLEWVRKRFKRIDVLIISAGANNVKADKDNAGFGQILEKCILSIRQCSKDQDFMQSIHDSIADLPRLYNLLQTNIYEHDAHDNPIPEDQIPSVILITEYFDPTRDANGNFPTLLESYGCVRLSISPDEWKFLYNNMVVPLNNEVRQAAIDHNWTYVGGIADAFRKHGYCASPGITHLFSRSWVVKAPQSINDQGNQYGTGHPDLNGQNVYREKIKTALIHANPPRTKASATAAGLPYQFGAWTADEVKVKLTARNPIFASGVRDTYYSIDGSACTLSSMEFGACLPYTTPFTITESGRHVVNFFSFNKYGAAETRSKPVEVLIDKDPPVMTCSATPDNLWPPNKSMMDITVSVTAVDAVSGPADYTLVNIQDSTGDVTNTVQGFDIGTSDTQGSMLVDRSGNAGDRLYTLTYQSQDAVGNVGTCDVVVTVPHDQREKIKIM